MRRRGFISQTCRVVFCSSSSTCLPHYDCPRLILGCLIVWQLSLTTIDWDRLTHSRVRMGDTEQPVNDRPSRYPQKKKAVRGRQLNSRIPPCSLTHCGPFRSATSHDMNNATELLMEPPPRSHSRRQKPQKHSSISRTHHKDNPGWLNGKKHAYIPSWQLAVFGQWGLRRCVRGEKRSSEKYILKFCPNPTHAELCHGATETRK